MSVFRKLFGVLLAALLLGGALKVGGDLGNDPAIEGSLKPEKVHREAAEEIVERLELHYRRLKFDDALSAQVLEQYLQDLDPNRLYFTQQDVDDFQPYRDQLDNQLRDGVLEAGYSIFNRFQSRLEDRLTEILATLEGGFEDWDFDGDGKVLVDRSEADWAEDQDALDAIWRGQLRNAVLSMRLNGTSDEEISKRLTNRYESQLSRVRQNTPEDVFQPADSRRVFRIMTSDYAEATLVPHIVRRLRAEAQLGEAQALELWIADRIVEKQSLTRAFDPVPQAPIGTSGVERGLIAARLRPALTSLATQGDGRIDLRFDQVDFAQLGAWLSAAHPGWGYRIDSFRLEALQGDGGAEGGSGHISGRVAAWISLSPQDP